MPSTLFQPVRRGQPRFLASVASADEAAVALGCGADIIDAKNPAAGALGALPPATIAAIVRTVAGRAPVSATAGDLPLVPATMVEGARAIAATGVPIVKVGLFAGAAPGDAIAALGRADLGGARLFAVMMADQNPDFDVIPDLQRAGFLGVMLDTAGKTAGSLPDVLGSAQLQRFVASAHAAGLLAGLAGSLRLQDIAPLVALGPDLIGFRGALCDGGRQGALSGARVSAVRAEIDRCAALQERSVA